MKTTPNEWFTINNVDAIDSPALIIYADRVQQNINTLLSMIDDINRLRPHVKTSKSKEACQLLMAKGIRKFKCATIAEADMLGSIKAPDVLLAYQPVYPKTNRFIQLVKTYPGTKFSCLVDNHSIAKELAEFAAKEGITINVLIDLNVGMNRTGIIPGKEAVELYQLCSNLQGVQPVGLHIYDGHIHDTDLTARTVACNAAFAPVEEMWNELVKARFAKPVIVAGGTPTFPVHAARKNVECSPGTFIYWDKGYGNAFAEQNFVPAALVISRIISTPQPHIFCLDLGHKSIASENNLEKRVLFLNAPELKFISQSEEHLVVEAMQNNDYKTGDVLYGIPYHICPTCALYEKAIIVTNGTAMDEWKTVARDRKINI